MTNYTGITVFFLAKAPEEEKQQLTFLATPQVTPNQSPKRNWQPGKFDISLPTMGHHSNVIGSPVSSIFHSQLITQTQLAAW